MIKADYLPEPPVPKLVDKLLTMVEWGKNPGTAIIDGLTIDSLGKETANIKAELKAGIEGIISPKRTGKYANIDTTLDATDSIRQVHDVGTMLTALYTALQGRDKTMGIKS